MNNGSNNNQQQPVKSKKVSTKTLTIPVRVEIKSDGRAVYDVNQLHNAIAKAIALDKTFNDCKLLVKKDPSSINLDEVRDKRKSQTEPKPTPESKDEAVVPVVPSTAEDCSNKENC